MSNTFFRLRNTLGLVITLMCLSQTMQAQSADSTANQDTLRVYELGEVVSSGRAGGQAARVESASFQKVQHREIQQRDALSVGELAPLVPAARVQTNSRGESLLFLRGAGERQIALFLDGALLNIPWDNRVDLSLIPADLVGQMTIAKGAGSLLYGPNILGGVVNISTLERHFDGYGGVVRSNYGETERNYSLLLDGRSGDFNFIVFGGLAGSDGYLLPNELADANLDNQNPLNRRRSNTDFERSQVFGRAEYAFDEATSVGLSVSHIDAEKGIAAETHRGDRARFWRYPVWQRSMITLNGRHNLNARGSQTLRASLWLDLFNQEIDSYRDETFKTVEESEFGDDVTMGGRVTFAWNLDKQHTLNLALFGFDSRHDEEVVTFRDTTLPDGQIRTIESSREQNEYQQQLGSVGLEYLFSENRWSLTAGLSFDAAANPKAGVFEAPDAQTDFGASIGGRFELADNAGVFANVARRTRFPTPREQFSAALGKFNINPDLGPEVGLLTELGGDIRFADFSIEGAFFYNLYADGIAKETLDDGREQRINLDETLVTGLELAVVYRGLHWLDLNANGTILHARGNSGGSFDRRLEYRPEFLAGVQAMLSLPADLELLLELESVGAQYGDNAATDQFEKLDAFSMVHVRLSRRFLFGQGLITNVFARLNNITDAVSYSQLGIPGAGRTLRAGLEIVF